MLGDLESIPGVPGPIFGPLGGPRGPKNKFQNIPNNFENILKNFHLFDLKIIAYMGLLIYWSVIITGTFSQ